MTICNDCGQYGKDASNCDKPKCYFDACQRLEIQPIPAPPSITPKLNLISIAGVDDGASIADLKDLVNSYPQLELGVLYFDEAQNKPRYPSKQWRQEFLSVIPKDRISIHLCGAKVFQEVLKVNFHLSPIWTEISKYGRVQLNINSRKTDFDSKEVFEIYTKLLSLGCNIVLQFNEKSEQDILKYLAYCPQRARRHIDVLVDYSRGTGMELNSLTVLLVNEYFKGHFVSFAGGINPTNVKQSVLNIEKIRKSFDFGIDLESGVRDNFNRFSIAKLKDLLSQ